MIRLQVQQLTKSYRNNPLPAVEGVSLDLPEGNLLSLVGESGSGKTTLLRLLAGLEQPDQGTIILDGKVLSSTTAVVPPEKRGIGLVFQHHALFPHLTVARNIAFGLRNHPRGERAAITAQMLELVGLSNFGKRYPHQLSGGERQRVALARALAPGPRLLLLDEPFSSLDARLRQTVRDETRAILKRRGATALFVTHDTGDALSIADQIVVLKNGKVQQVGSPSAVYHSPSNAYVASFFGSCNFLPSGSCPCPDGRRVDFHIGPPAESGQVDNRVWIRPEDLEMLPIFDAAPLKGTVSQIAFHGSHLDVILQCESGDSGPFEVNVRHQGPLPVHVGETWAIIPKPRRN